MKDYFNKRERDTHLIIMFMAEIVSNFKGIGRAHV